MTSVQIFWKDLEKYGLVKDSQFILNIPLTLLEEIFDKAQEIHKNSEIPNLTEKPTSSQTTSDKWKEYQDWLNEVPEISDEEIEKGAEDWQEFRQGAGKESFEQGAKWYREQLK